MRNLSYAGLPRIAVAQGATTPNPGYQCLAWSTTLNKVVFFNGSSWSVVDESSVSQIGNCRLTNSGGALYLGGREYRGVGVNAYDMLIDALTGATTYVSDLDFLATKGVRLVRVAAGPLNSAGWASFVGTNGSAPLANYQTRVTELLNAAHARNIGVIIVMGWTVSAIAAAIGSNLNALRTAGSPIRNYMSNFAGWYSATFKNHPALAAYQVGNEWADMALVAKFASDNVDTSFNHLNVVRALTDEMCAAIRANDRSRVIMSSSGQTGAYQSPRLADYTRQLMFACDACDVIDLHIYPATDPNGSLYGDESLGGLEAYLREIRRQAKQLGKAVIVGECGGEYDYSNAYGLATGVLSQRTWEKSFAAGIDIVLDWSWYTNNSNHVGWTSNLKVERLAVMDMIKAANDRAVGGHVHPSDPLLPRLPIPDRCASSNGTSTAFIRIPTHPDLSLDTGASAKIAWMFWIRRNQPLTFDHSIVTNLQGNNGMKIMGFNDHGLVYAMGFGSNGQEWFTPGTFNYMGDCPPTGDYSEIGEWKHVAIYWDAATSSGLYSQNMQFIEIYVNGMLCGRMSRTGRFPSALSTNDLFLLANDGGTTGNSQVDIFDLMVGKNFHLNAQHIRDYLDKGVIPAGMQHRWRLSGNAQDSIGTLHASQVGAGISWKHNGIGTRP